MANPTFNPAAQFNLITTSNTFADWVSTTNQLVQQNNDLAANNFYKATGTLYLNDPNLALQTNSTSVFGGTSYFNTAVIQNLKTTGDLTLSGNTIYQSNNFLINANSIYNLNGSYGVFRPYGHSAELRWNESQQYWEALDVNNTNLSTAYSKLVTANQISSSLNSVSTTTLATSSTVNTLFSMVTATSAGASNTFIGTSGSANPVNGVVTFKSNNGIALIGTGNTIYFNTPQDLRNTATPTFASLNLTAPLAISQGGTGANNFLGALNNLLPPTGQISGYVLTTTGAGQYYWGVGGGGGGGSGGNIITTSRKYYTATDGQIVFTGTPPYKTGAGQLRLYINGVRQYTSEYTETSNTTFSLTTAAASGDQILAEVDAYVSSFYANNTAYTANTTYLSLAQNTIQLALDGALGFTKSAYDQANVSFAQVSILANTLANTVSTNVLNSNIQTANSIVANTFVVANTISIGNQAITVSSNIALNSNVVTISKFANIASATVATANITTANITTASVTTLNSVTSNSSTANASVSYITTGNISTATIANETVTSASQINSLGVGVAATGTAGEIRATNNITAYYSDDNLKDRLGNIDNALEKLLTLNGFYYQANKTAQDLGYSVKREVGVSAQEVQAIMPEVVVPAPISDKYLTVHYERLIPLIVEAIKELKAEVNEIKGLIK